MSATLINQNTLNVNLKDQNTLNVSISEQGVIRASVQGVIPYSLVSAEKVVIEKTAGEIIGSHKIVKLADDGLVYYASCDNINDIGRILGMSLNSANSGGMVRILTFGRISDTSFVFNTNKSIFLGLNGQIVQDIPAEAVFIQRLGKVLKTDEILIDLDEPITLI